MKRIILLFSVLFISCASAKNFTFQYFYNGEWRDAKALLALPLNYGEDLWIRVKEERFKSCDVFLKSGDFDKRVDCKGSDYAWIYRDVFNDYNSNILSLTQVVGSDAPQKALVVLGGNHYEAVPLKYTCPHQNVIENQFTCVRAKGFEFKFKMDFPEAGRVQVYSSSCGGREIKEIYEVNYEKIFMVKSNLEEYCPIRIDFVGSSVKRSSTLHVLFY